MNRKPAEPLALLAALGHASRFRIAVCLLEGERCVSDLAAEIGLSQSCTTRHVQALERAGFVRSRRDGKRVLVGIEHAEDGVAGLVDWLAPRAARPRNAPRRGSRAEPTRPQRAARTPRPRDAAGGPARPVRARRRADLRAGEPAEPRPVPEAERVRTDAPRSGTHAAPPEAQPSAPRRIPDSIEDFLL